MICVIYGKFTRAPIFSEIAHLFQTQWAICPNRFEFWAEAYLSKVEFVVCNYFNFNKAKLFLCGKGLTLLKQQNFGLVQI